MEEYEILEELKMHIRCSKFAQKLFCDGVSVDFLKSTLDLILKQKAEIEKNKAAGNASENHGHWSEENLGLVSLYRCSKCGSKDGAYEHDDFKYCPDCGAKMDGKESNV